MVALQSDRKEKKIEYITMPATWVFITMAGYYRGRPIVCAVFLIALSTSRTAEDMHMETIIVTGNSTHTSAMVKGGSAVFESRYPFMLCFSSCGL